jgi:peptidoglycan/LPS O-acetylase OafA/YrhL
MVVLAHCHDLSMEPALSWVPHIVDSRLAVEGFFVMSGCLIVASYDRSPSLASYLEKRARRILPAYWGALIVALILGMTFTTLKLREFCLSSDTWKYVLAHLGFATHMQPTLPGVFCQSPFQASVNGALWTIKIEVLFYLCVPVMVTLCRRLGTAQTLGAIFWMSAIYRAVCEHLHWDRLAVQLPGQLSFFVMGALAYYHYPYFKRYGRWMWTAAVCGYLAYFVTGFVGFRAVGLSLMVMCVGLLLPPFKGPTKYGDFSYGTYVLHCPIIQMLIALGIFHAHPLSAVALVFVVVAILSIASWNFVEKPFLDVRPKVKIAPARIVG